MLGIVIFWESIKVLKGKKCGPQKSHVKLVTGCSEE